MSRRLHRKSRRSLLVIALAVCALCAAGIGIGVAISGSPKDAPPSAAQRADFAGILPAPISATPTAGQFTITGATSIHVSADSAPALAVADYLATLLRPATGYPLPVAATADTGGTGVIRLVLTGGGDKKLDAEGYRLDVSDDQITATAAQPAGLFYAVQTLRQLLPPQSDERGTQRGVVWSVPAGHVLDYPRFVYRAAGLDVARHFFGVADVERYIDEIALYKVNYLHLHLTDDQGWRLAIDDWPKLTEVGARTEVGGGAGGFYTQDDYRKLVAYAQARYVTIIPEIDLPGHVTAALASYPELSCDGKARSVFTGIDTGFSSLCAAKPATFSFLADVIRQIAALTPGPYVGIGGDEAQATSAADYAKIVGEAAADVRADGKAPWGWQETANASIGTPAVATYWNPGLPGAAIKQAADNGTQLVLDPANHTYLDQKYDASTALGLHWAGYVDVQKAYAWDPGTYLPGVNQDAILGVEADLWTETVATTGDIDYMAFPRLPAVAEIGWSAESTHDWPAFRDRLAAQGPRWRAMGVKYYHSPEVPWPAGS
ncbi:MAG TPA: beta-N-acetylhexosaminidase [Actinocrinis sp.]|nr:beta-N-acetylhexosaminidase [Actinocrinis sp.]